MVHDASGYFYDDPKTGKTSPIFPFPAFEVLQRKSGGALSALFAYRPARKLNVMVGQQAEITGGEYVSGGYFPGLGIVPAAGRLIAGDDDRAGRRRSWCSATDSRKGDSGTRPALRGRLC